MLSVVVVRIQIRVAQLRAGVAAEPVQVTGVGQLAEVAEQRYVAAAAVAAAAVVVRVLPVEVVAVAAVAADAAVGRCCLRRRRGHTDY